MRGIRSGRRIRRGTVLRAAVISAIIAAQAAPAFAVNNPVCVVTPANGARLKSSAAPFVEVACDRDIKDVGATGSSLAVTDGSGAAVTGTAAMADQDGTTGKYKSIVFTPAAAFGEAGYTVSYSAVPSAAGDSTDASTTFTIDNTAPAAPALTAPTQDQVLNGTTAPSGHVSFAGTAEPGSSVALSEGAFTLGVVTAAGNGTWSMTRSFADGAHSVTATATDAAGNVSAASAGRAFSLDTVAPATPAITAPTDAATLPSTTVKISGTADPSTPVTVSEGTATLGTVSSNSSGAWTLTGSFVEGAHTITVHATDPAGNNSVNATRNFSVHSVVTVPVITSPARASTQTNKNVSISGTAGAGDSVTVYEGTTSLGTAVVAKSGSWSITSTFTDGDHTVTATSTDANGNTALSQGVPFSLDSTPPDAPAITSPAASAIVPTTTSIGGTAEPSTKITVREGTALLGSTFSGRNGAWALGVTLGDGSHTVTATATDSVGNTSANAAPATFTVDATPPVVTITTDNGATFTPGQTVTIEGTARDERSVQGVTLQYFDVLGNLALQQRPSITPGSSVTWSSTPASLLPGIYRVVALATDEVSNRSAVASVTFYKLTN